MAPPPFTPLHLAGHLGGRRRDAAGAGRGVMGNQVVYLLHLSVLGGDAREWEFCLGFEGGVNGDWCCWG